VRRFADLVSYFAAYNSGGDRLEAAEIGWIQDYPAGSSFIAGLFSCNRNPYFCDHAFERRMQRALAVQVRDPRRANGLWGRLEREIIDRAIAIPLVNPKDIDFVSKRVGNYQRHPVLGVLISQFWVR
jgi:peptide/nickel transport system substrate-binding protein